MEARLDPAERTGSGEHLMSDTQRITSPLPGAPVVRSALPRRLRVELPVVCGDAWLAAGVAVALARLPGVETAAVNAVTGRALLTFAAPIEDLDRVLGEIAAAVSVANPIEPAS